MKKLTILTLIFLGLAGVTTMYTNCGQKVAEEGSVISSVPVPGINHATCTGCGLTLGEQYNFYAYYISSSTCSATTSTSTVVTKGAFAYDAATEATYSSAGGRGWTTNTIPHGNYTLWVWVDANKDGLLGNGDYYSCETASISGAAIGTISFNPSTLANTQSFAPSVVPAQ
jgi:hypothetical protein